MSARSSALRAVFIPPQLMLHQARQKLCANDLAVDTEANHFAFAIDSQVDPASYGNPACPVDGISSLKSVHRLTAVISVANAVEFKSFSD